jgi:hypothetical protein
MTIRRVKGILNNFLSTYTSRYSDFRGYWLFGLLVADLAEDLEFSLLTSPDTQLGQVAVAAITLAAERFNDQMAKGKLSLSHIRDARMRIHRRPEQVTTARYGLGYNVEFVATMHMVTGKVTQSDCFIYVAPHNPSKELRSSRV